MRTLNSRALGFVLPAVVTVLFFATPTLVLAAEWHIQDNATGGDCSSIGSWDIQTKTCTLTQDLSQGIIIDGDNVILDGNGRTVNGSNLLGNGVYLGGNVGVTVKDLNIQNFTNGIYIRDSYNNTLTNNTASNNQSGIYLYYTNKITLTGNTISNNSIGINIWAFLALTSVSGNTVTNNTISNNTHGIDLNYTRFNHVYQNNFIGNAVYQYFATDNFGNVFNLAAPIGGNYWSEYDTPAEVCNDLNNDNFCDAPFPFTVGQDNLPWTTQDGWLTSPPSPESTATLTVNKIVVNDNEGTSSVADFPLFFIGDSPGEDIASLTDEVPAQVAAGTYTVSETSAEGYTATFSGDCDSEGHITLAAGDSKTCTITNDDTPVESLPPSSLELNQYANSVQGSLPEGAKISDTEVTFTGQMHNPNTTIPFQLQVELRQFNEPFTGEDDGGILTSQPVPSGGTATLIRPGLVPGGYHWRARLLDGFFPPPPWIEFGIEGDIDFEVLWTIENHVAERVALPAICSLSENASHLVFVTHGWGGTAEGWVSDMEAAIRAQIPEAQRQDWDICSFDWREEADRDIITDLLYKKYGVGTQSYIDAFHNARTIGRKVGRDLVARNQYDTIHFIAHSAGSNVIQSAAELVRIAAPQTLIHLTFLDGFDPLQLGNDGSSAYGRDPLHMDATLFRPGWWAEQYVDMRDSLQIIEDTNLTLPQTYNFEVQNVDPDWFLRATAKAVSEPPCRIALDVRDPLSIFLATCIGVGSYLDQVHAWPHDWYATTIGKALPFGFSLALEAGQPGFPYRFPNAGPNNSCVISNDTDAPTTCPTVLGESSHWHTAYLDALNALVSIQEMSQTGIVIVLDFFRIRASPSSPVWFTLETTTEETTNILRFDYEFITVPGSENVLTVFVDDNIVHKIDERITDPGMHTASEIPVGELAPGVHSIGFRMDPFTDAKSAIDISNVQLGLLTTELFVDAIAPTTFASTTGALWRNGAYIGTTTVSLFAQDNEGGVGVEKTEYSFDGGQTWILYVNPFLVATEGTTTLRYRSTDFFGNVEDTKTVAVKIVSVKWFLEDALAQLQSIVIGNNDIDKTTDALERDLAKIITDALWVNRNRLSFPKGLKVLTNELEIIKALEAILNKAKQKNSKVSLVAQAQYRDAQNEIVQSTSLLSTLSFDKAKTIKGKNATGQKALDKLIARIQKMQERAVLRESVNTVAAEKLYGAVWFFSEALLKASGAVSLRALDLGGLYDPDTMKDVVD